jgi:GNAT superfamily N-acetyltransferase
MHSYAHTDDIRTTIEAAVELRSLEHGDRATLLEIFDGLGTRSRRFRFLTPKPRLTESELTALTDVDHRDHVAVVAVSTADDRPIGIARFIRWPDRPDAADVAIEVVDAWQNRGVGALLTGALAERARGVGVRRFTVLMDRTNDAARHLLHHSRHLATVVSVGAESVELDVSLGVG